MVVIRDFIDYQAEALRTAETDLSEFTPIKPTLLLAALGLAGEAGEFVELVKKHAFHGQTLDITKAAKELGDVLWYLALGAAALGLDLQIVAQMNSDKLRARYPNGFSAKASAERRDL